LNLENWFKKRRPKGSVCCIRVAGKGVGGDWWNVIKLAHLATWGSIVSEAMFREEGKYFKVLRCGEGLASLANKGSDLIEKWGQYQENLLSNRKPRRS